MLLVPLPLARERTRWGGRPPSTPTVNTSPRPSAPDWTSPPTRSPIDLAGRNRPQPARSRDTSSPSTRDTSSPSTRDTSSPSTAAGSAVPRRSGWCRRGRDDHRRCRRPLGRRRYRCLRLHVVLGGHERLMSGLPVRSGGRPHPGACRRRPVRLLEHRYLDPAHEVGDEVVEDRSQRHEGRRQDRPDDGEEHDDPEVQLAFDSDGERQALEDIYRRDRGYRDGAPSTTSPTCRARR